MKYRTFGRTGIKVSPYCLGAMMFGRVSNADHDDGIRIIHKALDFGINFIDTADRYSNGESEEIVGKAPKGRRQNVVLATRVPIRTTRAAHADGSRRRSRHRCAACRPTISTSFNVARRGEWMRYDKSNPAALQPLSKSLLQCGAIGSAHTGMEAVFQENLELSV
jgi:hypothetical protein